MKLSELTAWVGKAAFSVVCIMALALGLTITNGNFMTAGLFPLFFTVLVVLALGCSVRGFLQGLLVVTSTATIVGFLAFLAAAIIFTIFGAEREFFIPGSYATCIAVMVGVAVDFLKERGKEYQVSRGHNFFSGILQAIIFWALYVHMIRV